MNLKQAQAMSDDKLRKKIAKLCGWVFSGYPAIDGNKWAKSPEGEVVLYNYMVPNYPQDLNAMYEAEKQLSSEQAGRYQMLLSNILGPTVWNLMRATARQRAEAFVMAMEDNDEE